MKRASTRQRPRTCRSRAMATASGAGVAASMALKVSTIRVGYVLAPSSGASTSALEMTGANRQGRSVSRWRLPYSCFSVSSHPRRSQTRSAASIAAPSRTALDVPESCSVSTFSLRRLYRTHLQINFQATAHGAENGR
jgi:hypothetical protein